jgi:hypothetical protein
MIQRVIAILVMKSTFPENVLSDQQNTDAGERLGPKSDEARGGERMDGHAGGYRQVI